MRPTRPNVLLTRRRLLHRQRRLCQKKIIHPQILPTKKNCTRTCITQPRDEKKRSCPLPRRKSPQKVPNISCQNASQVFLCARDNYFKFFEGSQFNSSCCIYRRGIKIFLKKKEDNLVWDPGGFVGAAMHNKSLKPWGFPPPKKKKMPNILWNQSLRTRFRPPRNGFFSSILILFFIFMTGS